jgi:hypothetical protein
MVASMGGGSAPINFFLLYISGETNLLNFIETPREKIVHNLKNTLVIKLLLKKMLTNLTSFNEIRN